MLNEVTAYLKGCLTKTIEKEKREADYHAEKARILEEASKLPDAYLTTVAMEDEPLVLFVGDKVMTKYGDSVIIKSFDVKEQMIYFEDHEPLPDHRITFVIARRREGFEFSMMKR